MAELEFKLHFLMESVAFGLTDGIVCFLGIIVGVARATGSSVDILIAAIIGGIADALGNSIGFFVSQSTERAVQMRGAEEGNNMHIHSKKEVWLSGVFAFLATLLVLVLLLMPFALFEVWTATIASFIIGTVSAFILGTYIGNLSKENRFKCGAKYAFLTIVGAVISYGVGEIIHIYI